MSIHAVDSASIHAINYRNGECSVKVKEHGKKAEYKFDNHEEMIEFGISLITTGLSGAYETDAQKPCFIDGNSTGDVINQLAEHVVNSIRSDSSLYDDIKQAIKMEKFNENCRREYEDDEEKENI